MTIQKIIKFVITHKYLALFFFFIQLPALFVWAFYGWLALLSFEIYLTPKLGISPLLFERIGAILALPSLFLAGVLLDVLATISSLYFYNKSHKKGKFILFYSLIFIVFSLLSFKLLLSIPWGDF